MAGQLLINGTAVPITGPDDVWDPQNAQWGKEGDEVWTHARTLSSLAQSTMELLWEALDEVQASAILDLWFGTIVPAGCQIASITLPPKVASDTGALSTWKAYSGVDGDPIEVEEPQFTYSGPYYQSVRWRFHGVCHALES